MPKLDLEKYRQISQETAQKNAEKQRQEEIEKERKKQEAQEEHRRLQPIRAKKIIEDIPSIIEKATRKGNRVAYINVTYEGVLSRSSNWWYGKINYSLVKGSTAKIVFDYCRSQGLSPKIVVSPPSEDRGIYIEIRW